MPVKKKPSAATTKAMKITAIIASVRAHPCRPAQFHAVETGISPSVIHRLISESPVLLGLAQAGQIAIQRGAKPGWFHLLTNPEQVVPLPTDKSFAVQVIPGVTSKKIKDDTDRIDQLSTELAQTVSYARKHAIRAEIREALVNLGGAFQETHNDKIAANAEVLALNSKLVAMEGRLESKFTAMLENAGFKKAA